jgi:hypothetical protein
MKQIIKKVKKIIVVVILIGLVVGAAYLWMDQMFGTEVEYTASTTPEVIYQEIETERYDALVEQILEEEKQHWQDKAQLSAERQAAERLADEYADRANEKRLEEQSL